MLDHYHYKDFARKVVGVGSVGTEALMVLLMGDREDDPLFLQIKEATTSVLAPYAGDSEYAHQGERVVHGQRITQAASDAFLGWFTGAGEDRREFYVRQLRDMKGSAEIELMTPAHLATYGELCGATLARAHARTGDAAKITGYLGDDDTFDRALERFAVALRRPERRRLRRVHRGRRRGAHRRRNAASRPRPPRRIDRERVARTLTFWLRPAFVLRVVNRFQKIAGLRPRRRAGLQRADGDDPARRRSSARSCNALGGKDIAERIIDRYDLDGRRRRGGQGHLLAGRRDEHEHRHHRHAPARGRGAELHSRGVQRLFEQSWELKPR